jgi:hypothetical protein
LKLSLSAHLALSYLVVILIAMGIVIPLAWLAVERLYVNSQRENLLAQAQLVAATLGSEAPQITEVNPHSGINVPGIHTHDRPEGCSGD